VLLSEVLKRLAVYPTRKREQQGGIAEDRNCLSYYNSLATDFRKIPIVNARVAHGRLYRGDPGASGLTIHLL
jgi:hypothetical protein